MVTRLVACLMVGGVALSVGLGLTELHQARASLQLSLAQRITAVARNAQSLYRNADPGHRPEQLTEMLRLVASDPNVLALRIESAQGDRLQVGNWSLADDEPPAERHFSEFGGGFSSKVNLDRMTLASAPFQRDDRPVMLELLIDGAGAWAATRSEVMAKIRMQWLVLGVIALAGLWLVRRWFSSPFSVVSDCFTGGSGPAAFYDLAGELPGEFASLCEAIAGMLTRLECTSERLRQRELAFENLYQFAPAAILSLQPDGIILEANRRATVMFGLTLAPDLIGRNIRQFLETEDRDALGQSLHSLGTAHASRCELGLLVNQKRIDAVIESSPVRDADGTLLRIRMSILDVSQIKILQRQLADKGRLLNLIVDHMSDAIMLVDAGGKIAVHNQQLATLLHRRPESLTGDAYEFESFWSDIGILEQDEFITHMRQIEAEKDRPSHLRVRTRAGSFLFQGVPMRDGQGGYLGRLWVVQEITAHEQAERLVRQQANQLDALKRMGAELRDVTDLDAMLVRIAALMHEMIGVESVGIAIRCDHRGGRSKQVIHRGTGGYLLSVNRQLVDVIEQQVMPRVFDQQDVSYWPDLSRGEAWTSAFAQAGMTCLAAGVLKCALDVQGILWIARRGGERIERQHIQFLEAMLPLVAARIETAQFHEQMKRLELTDPVTSLPNRRHLEMAAAQLLKRPGHPWAAIVFNIDHFRELNDALGHEAADRLLARIGVSVRAKVRKSCDVGRMGGKQFMILCANTPREMAIAAADRVRKVIADTPVVLPDGSNWTLTASLGVASSPEDGHCPPDIFAVAGRRADDAKAAGRNRVVGDDLLHRRAS
ncbi:MAG: diguanylate cyclase [Phycisphaeraceae bacterium]